VCEPRERLDRRDGGRASAPGDCERRRLHVYDRHRAIVRGEPLILAHGRFERVERNQNVLVNRLETLGPLARQVSEEAEIRACLPGAHHFGHR
jgi:hypothetical protein